MCMSMSGSLDHRESSLEASDRRDDETRPQPSCERDPAGLGPGINKKVVVSVMITVLCVISGRIVTLMEKRAIVTFSNLIMSRFD